MRRRRTYPLYPSALLPMIHSLIWYFQVGRLDYQKVRLILNFYPLTSNSWCSGHDIAWKYHIRHHANHRYGASVRRSIYGKQSFFLSFLISFFTNLQPPLMQFNRLHHPRHRRASRSGSHFYLYIIATVSTSTPSAPSSSPPPLSFSINGTSKSH